MAYPRPSDRRLGAEGHSIWRATHPFDLSVQRQESGWPQRKRGRWKAQDRQPRLNRVAAPPSGGHDYPLTFSVDYPDRELDRLSSALRIFWVIPIAILAGTIEGGSFSTDSGARYAGGGIGVLFIPVVLMLLFRKKYPRWWYDWNLQLSRFTNRIVVYFALMDDRYPSTDEQQAVHLDFSYPDAEHDLSEACRWSSGCSRSPTTSCCSSSMIGGAVRRDRRLVCDPLHRPLPALAV